ncbi:MAG: T9SS type A sorting domain-containing protein [Candidatus Marinimicrobia bacterium]|nr:T9SS type A sorting domain-containing protein [Candidatus Neomarinimicrobiota bacterium]
MVKQKNIILFFVTAFILISNVKAKNVFDRRLIEKIKLNSYEIELKRESNTHQNQHSSIQTQTDYFLDTFDSDLDGWSIDDGWVRTDYNFHSPEHSINSADNNQSTQLWQITSPIYTLPIQPTNETIHYSFWLRNDMLDGDGDGDTYLDDFFSLSLLLEDDSIWNTTNFNSFDGRSYWCGDDELGGYGDTWVQFLDTPEVILQPDAELTAMMKWAIEDAEGSVEENIEAICENGYNAIDGWDQANVQISTDSGSTWDILVGNDPYDFQCGYGTVYNGFSGLPGWSGVQDWHEVTFDLTQYANQNVIIRFAFYSDHSWSTIDDDILTGLQIDDIQIKSHDVMFEDNADFPQMSGSGENWVEQLYDYWDDGSISGTESPQPGSITWEEYKPGTAFEGNILQNLTEYAGQDVKFRFQAFFDGNNDGGQGSGLFIDDFRIYSESTEFYPPPTNLSIENDGGSVKLTWSDLLNHEGDYLHINDSGENASFYETTLECQTSEGCITYMGNLFYIHGNSTVDSVYIYNKNETAVEVNIAAFSTIGQLFNPEPTFVQDVILSQSNAWNGFSVEGWEFSNPYIIGHTITDEISISLDTEASSFGAFFDGSSWNSRETGDAYYTTGIRAKITKEDSNVTYNVYRIDEDNNDFMQVATTLTDSTYIDDEVLELQEYVYGVSATYPENDVESVILIHAESISILPDSYQELSWDDGNFESNFELEQNDSLAIKFRASSLGQQVVRFKWYQTEIGGHVKLIILDNSENGTPGNVLYTKLLTTNYTATEGWNEYDLTLENWMVSGDFWIGLRAYSSTSPIAIDYDEGSNSSMYKSSNSEWTIINDWNIGLRIFLDCEGSIIDECGVCDGDNSSCTDCAGEVNGIAIFDECGVCGGDNTTCLDCAGVPNGTSIFDECGVCGGSGPTDECGCNDIPIGFCDCSENTFDECEVCGGDNSSCSDECGIPNGDNTSCTGCMDEDYTEFDPLATIPCEGNACCLTLNNSDNFIPKQFEIINLYPNPFNPQINIEYSLPTTSKVNVSIYNVQGQEVEILINATQNTGFYSISWNATTQNSGIYFVKIIADNNILNRKIMYLK